MISEVFCQFFPLKTCSCTCIILLLQDQVTSIGREGIAKKLILSQNPLGMIYGGKRGETFGNVAFRATPPECCVSDLDPPRILYFKH